MDEKTITYIDGHNDVVDQDDIDMAKLGKLQQFTRHFDFFSILGFACVTMITWEGIIITFIYSLENGGPAGSLYGFIFVWIGYGFAIASLAEMMSMWPTSGGQYHWTYTLAPPTWAPFLSYICGWQSVIAWQAVTPSVSYLIATMIQGAAFLGNPETYTPEGWQGTLIMWAVLALCAVVGIFGNKLLPHIDSVSLWIHLLGFIVVLACLGALSPTRATTEEVWETWYNAGYSTQGVSFLVGLQGIVFAWLGADGPIHMAEEIKNASTVVPWCLVASILINGTLGFGMLVAILYFGPSGDGLLNVLDTPTGYPYMAIFQYATGGSAGAIGLSVIIIVMATLACLMTFTASTREVWAFARDNGVPGARILSRIHKTSKLPLYCYLLNGTVTILLALINIGSSVALNAVISLAIAGYFGSYTFPISLLLWRRIQAIRGKGPELPWGPWRFGKWSGVFINAVGLAWIIVIFVFSFFPTEPLPGLTVKTMNWSSLAYGAITIFAVVFWFVYGKRTFKGPVRDAADGEIEPVLGWSDDIGSRAT